MNAIERTKECRIGDRVFPIFTEYSDVEHKLNSTVKYQSRIIRHDTLSIDDKNLVNIDQKMDDLNREIEDDLEQLYVMADKVSSIKHELSSNKMGLVFLKYHLYEDAIEHFKQAVELKPNFSQALNNLGKTYLRLERYSEALHVFHQGGKAEEKYADLNKYIGDVLSVQINETLKVHHLFEKNINIILKYKLNEMYINLEKLNKLNNLYK